MSSNNGEKRPVVRNSDPSTARKKKDLFKVAIYGDVVDLNDLKTYPVKWRQKKSYELVDMIWTRLGRSLFYMHFFYPDVAWGAQVIRVNLLCKEFAKRRGKLMDDTHENRLKLMKLLFRIEDEVENQC